MKFMLDTNICIYLIKRRPQSVIERFASVSIGEIGISVITLAELRYGATKSNHPKRNHEALELFTSPLQVAEFDSAATIAHGRIRTALERKGQPIGAMDLLIAAHAVSLGVNLITNNVKEFSRVPGLTLKNWVS